MNYKLKIKVALETDDGIVAPIIPGGIPTKNVKLDEVPFLNIHADTKEMLYVKAAINIATTILHDKIMDGDFGEQILKLMNSK